MNEESIRIIKDNLYDLRFENGGISRDKHIIEKHANNINYVLAKIDYQENVINRRELLKHYSNFLYEKGYLQKPNVLMEYELSKL